MLVSFLASTIWLPTMMNTSEPHTTDLRIDNIPLYELDDALAAQGIPAWARAEIIDVETKRRNGQLDAPPGTPESEPEALGAWKGTGCRQGQGCSLIWRGSGTLQSQWFENISGPTRWTNPLQCPLGKICTILSTTPSTDLLHWIAFRSYSGLQTPIYLVTLCFYTA